MASLVAMPSTVPLATSSSSSWLDTTFGSLLTTTFDFGYTIQQHNDEGLMKTSD